MYAITIDSKIARVTSLTFVVGLTLAIPALAPSDSGLISVSSPASVSATADRLERVLGERGLRVFMRLDHAEGAQRMGEELRATELVIFGSPAVGTALMQCAQTVGIDLPLKALIWEDEAGEVWLTYNDPRYLARRHQVEGCDAVIARVAGALRGIAEAATTP
jgi:uncharacterized protein (DUF302 family)